MRFRGSIFLSAFLLFQIQLILAKYLLPWFGGAPAVWTTCILFFQSFLLAGYAYAFFIDRKFSLATQAKLHAGLLLVALAGLGLAWLRWGSPVLPGDSWKPVAAMSSPILSVLTILTVAVGLPYLLLAANSPLVQRWYSLAAADARPYRLYAVSNAGSLLALLSYPFLVEPNIPLRMQAIIWAGLYGVFAAATIACLAAARKARPQEVTPETIEPAATTRATPLARLFWLVLAACPSSMLLAITNDLSQEVAVTPFVWVLPLAIYLLSFIICFDHSRWYSRRHFVLLTYAASLAVLVTSLKGLSIGVFGHLLAYSLFLFCFCMVCHGELYRLRPEAGRLTAFYLTVALGGVAGGLLVGVLAPLFFKGYWEFHLTILASWVLLTFLFWKDKDSFLNRGDRWHFWALVLLGAYILTHYTLVLSAGYRLAVIGGHRELANLVIAAVLTLLVYLLLRRRAFTAAPVWPRILIGLMILLVECFAIYRIRSTGIQALTMDRNFFGIVKVTEETIPIGEPFSVRRLIHGKILHGFQYQRADLELMPTSYYSEGSGIGLALRLNQRRQAGIPIRVGVTGLGAGGITAHVRAGDAIRFYEINPLVVDYAYGPQAWFSFLNKTAAQVEVKLGDARLSMEAELAANEPGRFDVLALDAFSSDSVPLHLLTREAFRIYQAHLRDADSIIAVNITNRFVDLRAPVLSIARELGFQAAIIRDGGALPLPTPSEWVLLSRGSALFDHPQIADRALPQTDYTGLIWTDDFSNLWKVLR